MMMSLNNVILIGVSNLKSVRLVRVCRALKTEWTTIERQTRAEIQRMLQLMIAFRDVCCPLALDETFKMLHLVFRRKMLHAGCSLPSIVGIILTNHLTETMDLKN
jgi:hypothetical protein